MEERHSSCLMLL